MSAKTDIDHLIGLCETAIHNANNAENGTNANTVKVLATEKNITSDTFSTRVYEEGEYTLNNNILWRCKVRTSSAPVEGAEWESKNVVDAILELSERIALLENK